MFKIAGFLFERTLGKATLIFGLVAAIFTWWQVDRYEQRQLGALKTETKHQAAKAQETEAVNADLEKAATVRDAAERAARGERLRNVRRDPYFDAAKGR